MKTKEIARIRAKKQIYKYRYQKAKEDLFLYEFKKKLLFLTNHPIYCVAKCYAIIELTLHCLFHSEFYGWCVTSLDTNLVHLVGIISIVILIVSQNTIEKIEDYFS